MKPPLLLLAAGASSRMRGRDKLLERVDGVPLLSRALAAGRDAGLAVYVTLPEAAGPRHALVGDAAPVPVPVPVPDAAEGIAASLRAGVAALPENAPGVLVLLADLPEIEAADLAALVRAAEAEPDSAARGATEDGRPGHPVYLPRRLFPALAALRGDRGAAAVLAGEAVRLVKLPGARALTDLDTPEAWAAWRAGRGEA